MSSIDERIVAMKFNNSQFEKGVSDTKKSLDDLKKGLNLDASKKSLEGLNDAGKNFSLAGMAAGVENIGSKFSALAVIGITALATIANKAVNVGLTLVRSLTIDPIKAGLAEYETKLGSIQTILANTQSKGTNLAQVSDSLQQLNEYSDKTIYNFAEMARNIGTFTAAGVGLETSVEAIKGIANLAAFSGSNSQQASTAMYQLSQAMAAGKVTLMDWNSVVNAGMGGEAFQNALKDTARVQGVAIDDIIASNGSFRDSLQEGWLSSDILTSTLSKFTGDLSDAQLESMGYTKEQIVGIQQMAKTAFEAATKVKTFSQLMSTLQESAGSGWAETWELVFGDIEEAKAMWTNVNNVIGELVTNSADARNKMIGDWDALGGRTVAIEAVKLAFEALMAIFAPIKEAFREIFPATTGQQLFNITEAIRDFTKSLKPSTEMVDNLKRTFKGVFAVLDIGWMIIKGLFGVFAQLFGSVAGGAGSFLGITANIGDFLVKVRDAIKNGEGLTKFFEGLGKVLQIPITLLKNIGAMLATVFDAIFGIDTSGFTNAVDQMQSRLDPIMGLGKVIAAVWGGVVEAFKKVWDYFAPFASAVSTLFKGLSDGVSTAMSTLNFDAVLDLVNTGLLATIVIAVTKFFKGLKKAVPAEGSGGFKDLIKGIFGSLTDSLTALTTALKATTLVTIAIAIALLTASIVALSMIDSVALTRALSAMTIMFTQLGLSMAVFEKIAVGPNIAKMPALAAAMILLAIAINILASAVKKLAGLDWNELARGLVGVTVLLGALAGVSRLMNASAPGMFKAAAGMILIAIAVKILASAVNDLAGLDWNELARGLVGVGVVLGALALFTKLAAANKGAAAQGVGLLLLAIALKVLASAVIDFASLDWNELAAGVVGVGVVLGLLSAFTNTVGNSGKLVLTAAGLVILGFALKVIAGAVISFASLDWNELARGLVGMGVALIIIAGAMNLMPLSLIVTAAGLVVVAAALVILAEALNKMGGMSWEEIGKGLTVLAASLLLIAAAMMVMQLALPGAFAMIIMAGALAILAPVLLAFGAMSWESIVTGLTMLAGVFLVIGLAGLVLTPVIPTLIGLGIAITLLGIGMLAAGLGLLAFSAALTALSVTGAVATVALVAMVTALIGLIPMALQQVGLGIIQLAIVIGNGAPAIVGAIVKVLMALIAAIITLIPQVVNAIVILVMALVNAIVKLVPFLVDAGLKLLVGILTGIANNIARMVTAAITIVSEFINGISRGLPRIVQAGINLIITFVESLADGIRRNQARMDRAGADLAGAIIDGMVGGLGRGISTVINAAKRVAEGALKAAKSFLGIKSPSKEFFKLGMYSDQGIANGLTEYSGLVARSAMGVGKVALNSIKKSMSGIASAVAMDIDMAPSIRPVLDLSAFKKDANLIQGMIGNQKINIDKTYASAAAIAAGQRENNAPVDPQAAPLPVSTSSTTYNQYNTSPKALSSSEIYRQTKNQLSVSKGALTP